MRHPLSPFVLVTLATAITVVACARDGSPADASDVAGPVAAEAGAPPASAQENKDLAALRAATARFHRLDVAKKAGYSAEFPPGCFASSEGGMGFHYLNEDNLGLLDPTRPQFLVYEPQKDGSRKLVAVEFMAGGLESDTPPVLFNQDFNWNALFGVWVLHVWVWQHNPAGLYKNYNPTVSCRYADVEPRAHH